MFANYDPDKKQLDTVLPDRNISIGFTFAVKNLNGNRRAIDIRNLSTKPEEQEILILPYSVFIQNKKHKELKFN